jgi:predicted dehydrogenase
MPTDKINIGLIGAGGNTKLRHIPGFQAIEGVEVLGVANRTIASSKKVADEFKIPKVYGNWMEMMEDPDIDAICIGTWPYMHCTLVIAALEYGKHVITEARMAMDAAEAHAMLDASKQYPTQVAQVVPAPHTLNLDKTIINLIENDYFGDIISIDAAISQGGFVDSEKPLHWRQNRDFSGTNIMGLGIWYEAIMRWIGPASSVQAITKIIVPRRKDDQGSSHVVSIPDHVEILCDTYSGPTMHIRFSDVLGHAPSNSIWIYGSKGTLHIDGTEMKLYGGQKSDDRLSEIHIQKGFGGSWRVEEEFINVIRGKEKVTHTSFEDGVRYMEFIEAVTISSNSGEKVHLPF